MKKKIRELAINPLISGSSVIFIGSILVNFFNFFYNLFMSRNLSIVDYGTLASLTSIVFLPGMIAGSFQPAVVNFAARYYAKKDYGKIRSLYIKIGSILFLLGLITFLLFIFFSQQISIFFKINDYSLIIISGLIIFIGYISSINNFLIQAKLDFSFSILIGISASLIKLILGIIFVFLGYSVYGAFGALLFSSVVGYLISFLPLGEVLSKKVLAISIETKKIIFYGLPASITLIGLTSFIMSDIIIVKHFMQPKEAGIYAGISLVSRVIFFLTAPIGTVMFPLIVQKLENKEDYNNILKLALILIIIPSILIIIFYKIFPEFSILFFLKKRDYLDAVSLLVPFAFFITTFSINSILINFFLSLKKTIIYIPVLFTAFLQIILISFFHNSLQEVVYSSMVASILLLFILIIFYITNYVKTK
ncbi:capsular polysaccharide biosynthesis protein [Candidatus Levyibacteriota bacterium]|nr:capsular polysaccharide biosynthesis protein [Candidatus Levybacteria bacterium]